MHEEGNPVPSDQDEDQKKDKKQVDQQLFGG
jgi:hypothetical protein